MNDSPERKNSQDEFASKLKAARAGRSMEGERRVVTILFCDVTGSTEMAEQLDPEDWAEIMDDAFDFLIAPIYRYEGTVARLMGDAILAFFGAPIAHEDDPQRAVLRWNIRRWGTQLTWQRGWNRRRSRGQYKFRKIHTSELHPCLTLKPLEM
jgi:class 3 adenylate cyclase